MMLASRISKMLLLLSIGSWFAAGLAQSLKEVTAEVCIRGDCANGLGALELATPWGKGSYVGNFTDSEFHGQGRLEIPISFTSKAVYTGNWERGIRSGRGKHWNGKGKLYIGEWRGDKRNGQGSYFINLPQWRENEHSEFWLKENTENYTGEFVNDHYQGQGTYRWANGRKFVGGFFASEKHGDGMFYYETGNSRPQIWNFGDFIR